MLHQAVLKTYMHAERTCWNSKEAVDAHIKNPNCFSDDHSKTALKESAEWLLNSLDESLKTSLRSVIAKKPQ